MCSLTWCWHIHIKFTQRLGKPCSRWKDGCVYCDCSLNWYITIALTLFWQGRAILDLFQTRNTFIYSNSCNCMHKPCKKSHKLILHEHSMYISLHFQCTLMKNDPQAEKKNFFKFLQLLFCYDFVGVAKRLVI